MCGFHVFLLCCQALELMNNWATEPLAHQARWLLALQSPCRILEVRRCQTLHLRRLNVLLCDPVKGTAHIYTSVEKVTGLKLIALSFVSHLHSRSSLRYFLFLHSHGNLSSPSSMLSSFSKAVVYFNTDILYILILLSIYLCTQIIFSIIFLKM